MVGLSLIFADFVFESNFIPERCMEIFFSSIPKAEEFPLKSYRVDFSMDRLRLGVDNFRCDVYLSDGFRKAAGAFVLSLVCRHAEVEIYLYSGRKSSWSQEIIEFKQICKDVLLDALNLAKREREIQIDMMAQAALVKFFTEELEKQFQKMTNRIRHLIFEKEKSFKDSHAAVQLKEELTVASRNRRQILIQSGKELFGHLNEIQSSELKSIRESNFGADHLLPDDFFSGPLLYTKDPDDFFMMEHYVLLGNRFEDPHRYDPLVSMIHGLLEQLTSRNSAPPPGPGASAKPPLDPEIQAWMLQVDNIGLLMNWFETSEHLKQRVQNGASPEDLRALKSHIDNQKKCLNFFYREFRKKGLISRISAIFEMKSICHQYCPPLAPQLVLQYLIDLKGRRLVHDRIERLQKITGEAVSLKPLQKLADRIRLISRTKRKQHLIEFLTRLLAYHRDRTNQQSIQNVMDRINLTLDEKTIHLSRANRSLYEFLLPHEQRLEEKQVINHVIVKADVRGSTEITQQMKETGLNPASYFSLNFFDPISNILPRYGAGKVFIEGDALILSIFEREESPRGWYAVARACGLSLNMISIVRHCNQRNRTYHLPPIEIGIGISFNNAPPTFLFDAEKPIMISSAINLADRMSSCSKNVRGHIENRSAPFNLYLFHTASDPETGFSDDQILRYNVNGIELSAEGFEKLAREIDLKLISCRAPEIQKDEIRFYTGIFPTATRQYQRLIIREDDILSVSSDTLSPIRSTGRKYYEVCTHPGLYRYLKEHA